MRRRALVFTCADRKYEDYAPLMAYSALAADERIFVEVGVEDIRGFNSRHGRACRLVQETFGEDRLLYHKVPWIAENGRRLVPNVVRFINQPRRGAALVYITDVDLLFLNKKIVSQNLSRMREHGLPYWNCVRPGTRRMSGLHFGLREALYPLPDISDLDLTKANDETVLYEIVRRRGHVVQDKVWDRPFPGIHLSPNREIEAQSKGGRYVPGWHVGDYAEAYRAFAADEGFKALRPLLSKRVQYALLQIDAAAGVERAAPRAPLPHPAPRATSPLPEADA